MNQRDRGGNELLIKLALGVMLVVRRCFPAMRLMRWMYHNRAFAKLKHSMDALLDPNSIRRNCDFAIPTKLVYVEGFMGEKMRVNLGDHIGYRIFMDGYFDLTPALVAIAISIEAPNAFYLDIGANIGDTSISVARRGIHTVGIDASTLAISELCHNLTLNGPLPYTVVHAAVTDQRVQITGEGTSDYLMIRTPVGNSGAASVHQQWNKSKASDLQMLALPRLVTDIVDSLSIPAISVIKLDVEGAEYEAINGMRELLERENCPLIFEYRIDSASSEHLSEHRCQKSVLDVIPKGYVCFSIECKDVTRDSAILKISEFNRNEPYENVLAVYQTLPECLLAAHSTSGLTLDFG